MYNRTKAIPATLKPTINYALKPFKVEEGREIPEAHMRGVFQDAPTAKARQDNTRPYPFNDMSVGDSFLIPVPSRDTIAAVASSVTASITDRKDRYGEDYTTRRVKNGIRVWRLA